MPEDPSKNIFEMLDLQSYRRHFLMFFVRREMIKEERVSVALLCAGQAGRHERIRKRPRASCWPTAALEEMPP